jgi:integrase/recombinase XerD
MGKSLPFADWPVTDQHMWLDLRRQGGPFDDHGVLAGLREASAHMYKVAYGRWLEWLQRNHPAVLTEQPAERATLAWLRTWLTHEAALSPTSRMMYFTGVLRVLRAAFPDTNWSQQGRVGQRLAQAAGPCNPARKQGRILSSRVLLEAGLRLAGPKAEVATTPLGRAKAQRDGAMVALLAMMPLRHRAFTGLRVGVSLIVSDTALTVVLPEELTKTGTPWEAEVIEPAKTALRRYLADARPFFMARTTHSHNALWVGNMGEPMSYSYVGRRIPDITQRLTGVKIPPHFFRDSAATTMARESPKAASMIAPMLGQSVPRTAERHYIQAGSVEVGRELAKMLKKLREKQ